MDTAVEIRLNNGYTVFKYAGNTTNLNSQSWMDKMFATVRRMEKSTLLLYSDLKKTEETLEDVGLDSKEFSCMGGGFPVRVEEVGVIGAILVSNQSHFINHDIIVKALSRYLHIDGTKDKSLVKKAKVKYPDASMSAGLVARRNKKKRKSGREPWDRSPESFSGLFAF